MPVKRWTAIPAKRSRGSDASFRALLVLGALGFAAALGVVALIIALGSRNPPQVDTYTPPKGGGIARMAATEFLVGEVAPVAVIVPDGVVVRANEGSYQDTRLWEYKVAETQYPLTSGASIPIELHSFLYIDDSGQVMVIDVPISIQEGGRSALAGPPSLSPYFGPEEGAALIIDASDANVGDATTDKIQRWAEAYFGDERTELRDIAGDPSFDYRGLGGYSIVGQVRIVEFKQPNPNNPRYIARIEVVATNGSVTTTQVFDLIVDESGAVPLIPAWGPLGAGWSLY